MNHQRKYFAQDYYIYEHFKKIFDKKVKAFGRRKMEREVQKLKHMYEECNKNPKKCSFKRPGILIHFFTVSKSAFTTKIPTETANSYSFSENS